ncbi:MAG TPA: hypothetical protein VL461_10425 [Dictyobacter sp.]|nr:hypothetical protein [Dictyobacter sp.]
MFKLFLKYLSVLCFATVLIIVFLASFNQPARAAGSDLVDVTPPTVTPTITTTAPPSSTASIALSVTGGGTPAGQAGTAVQLAGNGFTPGDTVNLYTTTDPTQCTAANAGNLQPFNTQSSVTINPDGTFTANTTWPTNANQPSTSYYVCAISTTLGTTALANPPFDVTGPVTASITPNTANAGDTITVTGTNWLPSQTLTVSITPGQGATPIAQQQVTSGSDGTFSTQITIPQSTTGGSYGIDVTSTTNPSLTIFTPNVLTVNVQATPSPTATMMPTPTPQPPPATTTTTTGSSMGGTPTTFLIFGMGGLGIILVAIGLTLFLSHSHTS